MRLIRLGWFARFVMMAGVGLGMVASARAQESDKPVTVTEDNGNWILSNGYLTAVVNKTTGDMTSLKVRGIETMGYVSGHHAGYWEQSPAGAARLDSTVTIDPAKNGGERVEVSVKGWSDGKNLSSVRRPVQEFAHGGPAIGNGAAAGATEAAEDKADKAEEPEAAEAVTPPASSGPPAGVAKNRGTATGRRPGGGGPGLLVDMEIRYSLGKGEHGIYTYAIYTHQASYGATQIGESRYGMKLNGGLFDWLSIDEQRNEAMPTGYDWDHGSDLNMKEARRMTTGVKKGVAEHKYDYSADLFDTPAFGWASTKRHVGLYFINPSMEFLSSGPKHVELTGHLDDGDGGDPTLLDYWRGTHYGGSQLPIAAGEEWTKVVGPVMIYVATGIPQGASGALGESTGATPDALFAEAKKQVAVENAKWPYKWVAGVDYTPAEQRGTVTGQLVLKDPQASSTLLPHLEVGLAFPDEGSEGVADLRGFMARGMTWQDDAKHYEFWVKGGLDGKFTIPKVRPGTYELHAIADGVLGEYAKASVTVGPGGTVDLGQLAWRPARYGQELWQIGIPNRSASEFLMGNDHWHWGLYIEYAKLFPKDVNYTVGQSDFHKDWFIYQVPHGDPNDTTGRGKGRETTWKVNFNVDSAPVEGQKAVLRLGIAGAGTRGIDVKVNGKTAGTVGGLVYNATINRDGIQGSWIERDLPFDGTLLKAGANVLTLTVPEGGLTSGVVYDVLRLELTPVAAKAGQ